MRAFNPKRVLAALLAAAALTGLCASGLLYRANNVVADALFQREGALEGDITVIGFDQKSLDELGPFSQWGRARMAQAIETLNRDPDLRPAVIGIDVLYAGHSDDPEADAALARAAARGGNVVVAGSATFGSQVVEREDGSFYVDDYAVLGLDLPYDELYAAAGVGHINSMYDKDGILRHGILRLDLPEGGSLPSFHWAVYERFCAFLGREPGEPPPTDSRHRWYVPFQGKPGAFFEGYSFADLLAGEIPPENLADRVVLMGPWAAGMQDDFPTAIDHAAKMYGVEYQANMVEALLAGLPKREIAPGPQYLCVFALSALALFFFLGRKILPVTVLWLALTLGGLGASVVLYQGGLVTSPLYLPLCVTVLYVAAVAVNYVRAALEKHRVQATFQRYVAPEIVTELLREGSDALELGGRLCEIAVLFVDIRGFTSMSEKLDAPQVVEILNRYLTLTSDCIFHNGGTLDKFVGDCTMAFWGAPMPQEDCVFKAVKTALDMVEGSRALSGELMERYGRTVSFGVGVHVGPAVVGNIGSPHRMDYTAIGDTVNTASRLESNAPGGQILVSRAVADALAGRVAFTSLGETIRLKGKAEGFEVLRVEGLVS